MSAKLQFGASEFQAFRDFLQSAAGIDLGENKQYLVSTRVRRILLDYKFSSLSELTDAIEKNSDRSLKQKVIDAMTTNETFWFRDLYPYEFLSGRLFPELCEMGKPRNRIWSAACSSGQEPYSISMVAQEYIRSQYSSVKLPLEIMATDLSSAILESAAKATFDRLSVSRGLEGLRLKDWFEEVKPELWQVKKQIRDRVSFRPQNLLEPFSILGKFDAIFCRNVLIYFSVSHKQEILERLHKSLNRGGYLILGSSESLGEAGRLFNTIQIRPGVVFQAR